LLKLADKINVKPSVLALGLAAIVIILTAFNVFGSILSSLVGFIYPAYMSFKAIETKGTDDDA
jgi:receptor expression-enhancing protein 5/6